MSENKIYNIEDIMNFLPHRYPFLLVDRLEVEVPGEKGIGIKNVTMNEEFFQGHFPGYAGRFADRSDGSDGRRSGGCRFG